VAEEWRPVVGFEGYYEVSNLGRVRSVTRVSRNGNGPCTKRGCLMKQSRNSAGYLAVQLSRDGVRVSKTVSSLIGAAFLGAAEEVDHRNRQRDDNRLENLRPATTRQNAANTGPRRRNKSGYKGVSPFKTRDCWRAVIFVDGKQKHLGYFDDPIDAARCYDAAAKALHGEFAWLNNA
jgi:hypothetical protein